MKKKIFSVLGVLLCLSSLIIYSCQKEIHFQGIPEMVSVSVSGRVLDENQLPVDGAAVSVGEAHTTSDINGNFEFANVQLTQNTGFIKVEKQGYFLGSRTVTTKSNSSNFVEIELITKRVSGKFAAASGGNVTISNGGSVLFESNSVINSSTQSAYTGEVSVSAFFINPSANNFSSIMPGALRGVTTTNQERALQSFGMLAVELSGSGGESLQLSNGKTATLTFPIPPSLQGQAPGTIPLWYFDEVKGLWIEEGSATKQGNNYVGKVTHFSFWNVDKPYALVDFEAVIMDINEQEIPFTKVVIKLEGDSAATSGSGFTDEEGKVWGKIPANQKLQLTVYNKCNVAITSLPIGPFTTNTNLGTITVSGKGNTVINFSGTVQNCVGEQVNNGFVNIFLNNTNYRADVNNGKFALSVVTCSDNLGQAIITGFDDSTNVSTDTAVVNISANSSHVILLKACGTSVDEFVKFNLNGKNYTAVRPGDSLNCYRNNTTTYVESFRTGVIMWQDLSFKFNGAAAKGNYYIYSSSINIEGVRYYMQDSVFVNITEYGVKGDYISGNFTGNLRRDSLNVLYPINCNFKLRRTN